MDHEIEQRFVIYTAWTLVLVATGALIRAIGAIEFTLLLVNLKANEILRTNYLLETMSQSTATLISSKQLIGSVDAQLTRIDVIICNRYIILPSLYTARLGLVYIPLKEIYDFIQYAS